MRSIAYVTVVASRAGAGGPSDPTMSSDFLDFETQIAAVTMASAIATTMTRTTSLSACSTITGANNLAAGTDPLFVAGGLAFNGGTTQTLALQPTSPHVNAGSNPWWWSVLPLFAGVALLTVLEPFRLRRALARSSEPAAASG